MNQIENGTTEDKDTFEAPVTRKKTNAFQYFYKNHSEVAVGIILSIILLLAFFLLQIIKPSVLTLDWKWIVVSAIPLIIALIIGGYIKSFKGFGFELETTLKEPLSYFDLATSMALSSIGRMDKRSVEDLLQKEDIARRKVSRLRFILSNKNYGESVIRNYMQYLPNLEYFEIIHANGAFICLIPISIFLNRQDPPNDGITTFISALENNRISNFYNDVMIPSNSIEEDMNLLEVLQTMRDKRLETAAVVNKNRIALGVIKLTDIEHQIANIVLNQVRIKGLK